MKHLAKILFALLLGASTYLLATESNEKTPKDKPQPTDQEGIQWLRYDEGLVKAEKENKHVLVDFTASWCGWCKKMDKETFSQPAVIKLVNDNFVPIKVWGDSREELDVDGYKISEQNLTRQTYGVSGFPSFWILKSDGSKLGLIRGYRDADYMMEALTFVAEKKYDSTATDQNTDKEKAGK